MPSRRRGPLAIASVVATTVALAITLGGCGGSGPHPPSTSAGSPLPGGAGFDGSIVPAATRPHDFTLRDPTGQAVSLASYRGRVTILTFLSTASASTATLIAQQIRGALDELGPPGGGQTGGSSVPALAVSLDPRADTPARVRGFLAKVSLSGRLKYLTGSLPQLRKVWRAYAIRVSRGRPADSEGSAVVLLLDSRGVARVSFPVEQLTPEGLAHDIRKLQGES